MHRYIQYPGLQLHGRTQLAPTSGAMGYGVPAAVGAALLYPERTVVNIAGDGDFLMTARNWPPPPATAPAALGQADQHRGRQRHLRHHPHAPGARVPGPRQRQRPVQPRLRALAAPTAGTPSFVERTSDFEAAFARALAAGPATLLHLKLDADVSTTRTTLSAIRSAALTR
jgi:acetolactate synthase-1/2/3 large subunit